MSYTASGNISRVKIKAWTSASSALTDAELLELLDDSLRSYIVPLLKSVRDEWFAKGTETVTPDANGRIAMPNSVASTVRNVWWLNNGALVPLPRIEPEQEGLYYGSGAGQPCGYILKGYELQIMPPSVGSISVRLDFMERPAPMVLDGDAALITTNAGGNLWNTSDATPLTWQENPPSSVAVISPDSPFSELGSVSVLSVNADSIEFTGSAVSLIEAGVWLADAGYSPFPNIPEELHPLLQLDVMRTIFEGTGDKRLQGIERRQQKMEAELRKTLAPRTQGSTRPLLNPNAPGMRLGRWGW